MNGVASTTSTRHTRSTRNRPFSHPARARRRRLGLLLGLLSWPVFEWTQPWQYRWQQRTLLFVPSWWALQAVLVLKSDSIDEVHWRSPRMGQPCRAKKNGKAVGEGMRG